MGVRIQDTVVEVPEAPEGQGASLLGAGRPPGHTRGHAHSLGLRHPGLTHQISTVMVPHAVGPLHILRLAVMMDEELQLDPVGKEVSLQIRDTAATLKRHFAVNMSEAERGLHVTENIVKADHL